MLKGLRPLSKRNLGDEESGREKLRVTPPHRGPPYPPSPVRTSRA